MSAAVNEVGNTLGSNNMFCVGASVVAGDVKPSGASEGGRLVGDSLFGVVGVSVGSLTGLVVGLSIDLTPGTKVGSEENSAVGSLAGLVVGLSTGMTPGAKVGSEEKRSPNKGLIVGTPVTIVELRRSTIPAEFLVRRTVVSPTEVVVATAAITTTAMTAWVVNDTPAVPVAAAAIAPAPAAADDPADAAA
jgi:hypothetical protein